MERVILAYCHENARLAAHIDEKLRRTGLHFDHVTNLNDRMPGQFVAAVQASTAPVVLLVTDNFLRSAACMAYALPMLQQLIRTNRVLAVVADGYRTNPETGQVERVETHFERVIHAIIYMNYWQSIYLELRQKKETANPDDIEAINRELSSVRDISVEIGDFLNTLRNAEPVGWEVFSANNFEVFFKKMGVAERFQKYRLLASADADVETDSIFLPEAQSKTARFQPVLEVAASAVESRGAVAEPVWVESFDSILEEPPLAEPAHFEQEQPAPHVEEPDLGKAQLTPDDSGFEPEGFDILASLENGIDTEAASEAAKARRKKRTAPDPDESAATPPPPKKTRAKKEVVEPTPPPPPEPVVFLEDTMPVEVFEKTEVEISEKTEPVEVPVERKLAPMPQTPTREEIEALVAEFVREDAAKTAAQPVVAGNSGETENRSAAEPVIGFSTKENGVVAEMETSEDVVAPRVTAMQLPHFQPVSANSAINDDIRQTQAAAHYWIQKGDFAQARLQAEELTMKFPARPEGWVLLGEIAEQVGDFPAARRHFEQAILVDDDFPGTHLRLARMLDFKFKNEKKAAVQHYRAAAKSDPSDWESTHRAAVICLENLGKHDRARRLFEKTVERNPGHAPSWYELAHLERHLGNSVEAYAAWERAIAIDPILFSEVEAGLFPKKEIAPAVIEQEVETPQKESEKVENQPLAVERQVSPTDKLTVLVTGATSGIGRATAEEFARHGHRVILTGRRGERLDELGREFFENHGAEILTACFDVRDRQSVEQMVENLPENWRDIDLLINNAGLAKGLDPIHEGDFRHWEEMIDTNLKGLLYMTRLVAPGMVGRRRGHIINVGSIAGKEVYAKGAVYNATKFAVDALTRAMRLDLAPHGVKISSISPGHVEETEFALVRFDGDADRARIYDDFQPLTSRDVAETIYFIATRPAHVAIHDIVLTGAQQASATQVTRSGRMDF